MLKITAYYYYSIILASIVSTNDGSVFLNLF